MPTARPCRTLRQQNKGPIPPGDMERLLDIAKDCCTVKNYVYQRYGGIKSLPKLYPGYTVQNEMTNSGLREQLGMPSVYFYLAIFDALGDIKGQWARTKAAVQVRLKQNENFSEEDRHYLRFLLKVNNAFEQVLNGKAVSLKKELQAQYEALAASTNTGQLCRWLCRQVRRNHKKLQTDFAEGFSMTERAYRYGDHGIYISAKEKRKRIFIPLTDNCQYKRQLSVRLYPEEGGIEIRVPVDIGVHLHPDYENQVGLAFGMHTMLTTQEGHTYGENLGEYQSAYTEWLRTQSASYRRNRGSNPGRKKYYARKQRYEGQLHSYINQELNRMLKTEKPKTIYIPKLPKPQAGGINKRANYAATLWQRGYIRKRLAQKCLEESVELEEVFAKGISSGCSQCGADGIKQGGQFTCPVCGLCVQEKVNTARNVKKRGQQAQASKLHGNL